MPEINFPNPETRRWQGPYLGDYYGDFYKTYNIDLENNPGNIELSTGVRYSTDSTDCGCASLSALTAFIRTNADGTDRWWAVNEGGSLYKTWGAVPTNLGSKFQVDTSAGTPGSPKDFTIHENDSDSAAGNNILIVTRDTDVAVLNDTGADTWNSNWWVTTKTMTALKTGLPHPIEYFPMRRISLIGDGNFIHIIDKNKNCTYARLVLPVNLRVEHIFVTAYRAWILCSGTRGNNGAVIEWDGSSESYNQIYDVKSIYPLSGVNWNEIPIVITDKGLILEYDGNGFSPMIRNGQVIALPTYAEEGYYINYGDILPRGMTVTDNGLVLINVGLGSTTNFPTRYNGGIWCLNPLSGNFYKKYSLGQGTDTETVYGHQNTTDVGAIKAVSGGSILFIAGGQVGEGGVAGEVFYRVWTLSRGWISLNRRGYFLTQFVYSDNISEMWENIWLKFSKFRATGSKIIIKAKGVNSLLDENRRVFNEEITWTSGTTFTITLAANDDALAVGDEVEILGRNNAGVLAHITEITGNHAALQTITIDETVLKTSGTSKATFDRWKKIGVIDSNTKYFAPLNIGIQSSFIQFKIELRGPATDYNIKQVTNLFKPQTIKKK